MRRLQRWQGKDAEEWRRDWGIPRLRIYGAIPSTNTLAGRLAEHGAPHGTVVLADLQTRGRGRRGRQWIAPAGRGVLLSFVARPPAAGAPGATPVRAGAIVADAIEAQTGVRARLKWPNDVLDDRGRKLAGILCEGALDDAGGWVVIGIGVNVLHEAGDFPPELRPAATSLRILTGTDHDRGALAGSIAQRLLGAERIAEPLSSSERAALDARHAFHQGVVRIDSEAATVTVLGILQDGALAVLAADGPRIVRGGTLRPVAGPAANVLY